MKNLKMFESFNEQEDENIENETDYNNKIKDYYIQMWKERYDRSLIYNYAQQFLESISLNDEDTIKDLINLELFKKASEMKDLKFTH